MISRVQAARTPLQTVPYGQGVMFASLSLNLPHVQGKSQGPPHTISGNSGAGADVGAFNVWLDLAEKLSYKYLLSRPGILEYRKTTLNDINLPINLPPALSVLWWFPSFMEKKDFTRGRIFKSFCNSLFSWVEEKQKHQRTTGHVLLVKGIFRETGKPSYFYHFLPSWVRKTSQVF